MCCTLCSPVSPVLSTHVSCMHACAPSHTTHNLRPSPARPSATALARPSCPRQPASPAAAKRPKKQKRNPSAMCEAPVSMCPHCSPIHVPLSIVPPTRPAAPPTPVLTPLALPFVCPIHCLCCCPQRWAPLVLVPVCGMQHARPSQPAWLIRLPLPACVGRRPLHLLFCYSSPIAPVLCSTTCKKETDGVPQSKRA